MAPPRWLGSGPARCRCGSTGAGSVSPAAPAREPVGRDPADAGGRRPAVRRRSPRSSRDGSRPPITSCGRPPAARARCQRSSTPSRWGSYQPPISSRGRRSRAGATAWIVQPVGSVGSWRSQRRPMPSGSWRASRSGPSSRKLPCCRLRRISLQAAVSPRRRQPSAASCRAQPTPSAHQWAPPSEAQWRRSSRPHIAGARQSGRAASSPGPPPLLSSWVSP